MTISRRTLLIIVFAGLSVAFWKSPEFKTVAAGVALFLFGMILLEQGFLAFSGGVLEGFLARCTNSIWRSLGFGIGATSITQSSSLVSVITISFLSSGLLSLSAGIGIIFGANLGTTTGAWLMAGFGMKVNIKAYAMPMLVFGLILMMQKRKRPLAFGRILCGVAFLFLGIAFMKDGFESFSRAIDLANYQMPGLKGVLVYVGIGVVATVLMQSSHATLLLIIAGLHDGVIGYDNALALAIGANVGTTISAILGSLSANVAGKRLAAAHLIFNVTTGIIAIAFLGVFSSAVSVLSEWGGFADQDTLRLATFHSLFNLVGVLVMLPFVQKLVALLTRILKTEEGSGVAAPKYLTEAAAEIPQSAIAVLHKELEHLFENAFEIIAHGLSLHRTDILSLRPIDQIVKKSRQLMEVDVTEKYYRSVKVLYSAIVEFATYAMQHMDEAQLRSAYSIRIACRNLAAAVKSFSHIQPNLERYLLADNEAMRAGYDQIRGVLASILREIYRVQISGDLSSEDIVLTFGRLRAELQSVSRQLERDVDTLIRDGRIVSGMATSLMNDASYTEEIGELLIEVGERLFISPRTDIEAVADELVHEEQDFSAIDDHVKEQEDEPPPSPTQVWRRRGTVKERKDTIVGKAEAFVRVLDGLKERRKELRASLQKKGLSDKERATLTEEIEILDKKIKQSKKILKSWRKSSKRIREMTLEGALDDNGSP